MLGRTEGLVPSSLRGFYDDASASARAVKYIAMQNLNKSSRYLGERLVEQLIINRAHEEYLATSIVYNDFLTDYLLYLCANMDSAQVTNSFCYKGYVADMIDIFCIFPMNSQLESFNREYAFINRFQQNLTVKNKLSQNDALEKLSSLSLKELAAAQIINKPKFSIKSRKSVINNLKVKLKQRNLKLNYYVNDNNRNKKLKKIRTMR